MAPVEKVDTIIAKAESLLIAFFAKSAKNTENLLYEEDANIHAHMVQHQARANGRYCRMQSNRSNHIYRNHEHSRAIAGGLRAKASPSIKYPYLL